MNEKKPVDENTITHFIASITRGPFKCLNEKPDKSADSKRVIEYGKGPSPIPFSEEGRQETLDIYDCAVYQAYLDMNRTISGVKDSAETERDAIAAQLRSFFDDPEYGSPSKTVFDNWHEKAMEGAYGKANQLTYGQIQKLINMAFKYLYCCRDIRDNKFGRFDWCHMALDTYTLTWLGRVEATDFKIIKKQYGWDGSWSKISSKELYGVIVEAIRKSCNADKWPHKDKPFFAEFYIWPHEASIESLHAVIKEAKRIDVVAELESSSSGVAVLKELCDKLGTLEQLENRMKEIYS